MENDWMKSWDNVNLPLYALVKCQSDLTYVMCHFGTLKIPLLFIGG